MGKHTKIQGSVAEAIKHYQESGQKGSLWQHRAFLFALENSENAIKSIAVLKKHLPKKFHPLIRFSQPKTLWTLTVEKGITATQLNLLLDDLSIFIARDIGYAPRFKVITDASKWQYAGFPLHFPISKKSTIPNDKEADKIIADFLSTSSTSVSR